MTIFQRINNLRQHEGFRRYAFNTSWLMAEKILRMFVGLFVGIWVARYLGPDQFGLLSYAQSFVFLFTAVATLGLDSIVVRELVRSQEQHGILIGSAFGLKLLGALLVLPVLFLAVQFTGNDTFTNLLVFLIASATIFQSFNVIDFFYQARVQSKYVAIANSVVLAISSLVKITLILNQAPLIAFALMTLFDSVLLSLGLIFFYKSQSKLKVSNWHFKWSVAKRLLSDSWPLLLSGFVISVYMKIDQVMIKEMLDAEAVGLYASAVKLSEAWYFIPMVIANSIFPAIIAAKASNKDLYVQRLQDLYKLMIWGGIFIAIIITPTSSFLVGSLYGESYQEASSILMIHVWAGIFVCAGIASNKWLISENLQVYSMINTFVGAILNVLMNYYLIDKIGINGAAIATLISYSVAAYLMLYVHSATRVNFFHLTKALNIFGLINVKKSA